MHKYFRERKKIYREAEARQRPRTQTVLWQEPHPMDSAIIMICGMQCVVGRAMCDANTLWAARMRYAICDMRYALWAARKRYAIRE